MATLAADWLVVWAGEPAAPTVVAASNSARAHTDASGTPAAQVMLCWRKLRRLKLFVFIGTVKRQSHVTLNASSTFLRSR
jgi:hypothetical protein